MNAIEDNAFTKQWQTLALAMPTPKAILSVSAHWFTAGTLVSNVQTNRTIYDMYGFPDELYRVVYDAPGAPELARRTQALLGPAASLSGDWGLDHGTWSVLRHMYPNADIPVFQLSVDRRITPAEHFALGQKLAALREEGVLILGSGNVVHNLGKIGWNMTGGFDWADDFDLYVKNAVTQRNFARAVDYAQAGPSARLAFPTVDHYAPLLYVLGAADGTDQVRVFNDARVMGSLSMTGYLFE